jgi:hypothetical protein
LGYGTGQFTGERFEMEAGTCKHFTGIQNKVCKVGISYDGFARPSFPCIKAFNEKGLVCSKYEEPTAEELKEWNDFIQGRMNMLIAAQTVVEPFRARNKGKSAKEVVECPCCKGKLHMTIAAYNGHVHGKCETDGCLAWME